MHKQNFKSPNNCGGGEGSPGSFRSPTPYPSPSGLMLPPPPPVWGYGTPRAPTYGHRPQRPYGSGGSPYGGWYGDHSPGNTSNRSPSPRYTSPPYSRSPRGNHQHYKQHSRGFTTPRQHMNYQGSCRTPSPYSTPQGRGKTVFNVKNFSKPSMLEDPWADLKPVSVADVLQKQNSKKQTTFTGKKGRYFS